MTDVATMEGRLRVALAGQRFRASLMVALGFLALLLASVGIYGVVAHSVAERTRELGIRIALGDRPSRLRWRVVGRSVLVAFAGVGIGFLAWTVVGRWVSVFFYDVRASDPVILVSATMAMLGVAAAAAYGPARRVSRIDPMVALRRD
jgi:ABC-type antimicrobial peptide transport system permease subunit